MAVDVGYWPLYRYTPETDLPSTTDEVSNTAGGRCCVDGCPGSQPLAQGRPRGQWQGLLLAGGFLLEEACRPGVKTFYAMRVCMHRRATCTWRSTAS